MRRALVVGGAVAALVLLPAASAGAHPLGNFTVNHSDALLFTPDGVDLRAVSTGRRSRPRRKCPTSPPTATRPGGPGPAGGGRVPALARDVVLNVDGDPVSWTVGATALEIVPGTAGLPTLRLTCDLRADADPTGSSWIAFRDDHELGRIGWREITADGDGVRLLHSPVPVRSPPTSCATTPVELLTSPMDVRARWRCRPDRARTPGRERHRAAPPGTRSPRRSPASTGGWAT